MSELSEIRNPTPPVTVDFHWVENGPKRIVRYEGTGYEYGTTATRHLVEFKADEAGHPKVEAPAGIKVLEYRWDFGDGSVGFGPRVSHQFEVVQPDIEVSLTIVDSLSRLAFTTKAITLINLAEGKVMPNVMRGQIVGPESVNRIGQAHDGGWSEYSVVDEAQVTRVTYAHATMTAEDNIELKYTVKHIRKGKLSLFVDEFVVDTASAVVK